MLWCHSFGEWHLMLMCYSFFSSSCSFACWMKKEFERMESALACFLEELMPSLFKKG